MNRLSALQIACHWIRGKMSSKDSQDGQESSYENEISQLLTAIGVLKREKKNAKSNLTRMLNHFLLY